MECTNGKFCLKRCPTEMEFGEAGAYCESYGMALPMPESTEENAYFTSIGATWIDIMVNPLFGKLLSFCQ